MTQAANERAILDIIEEFVDEGKSFTAFDITQEGYKRSTTQGTHGTLKNLVHATMNQFFISHDYDRSLITTPTGNAWLYHPTNDDISAYTNQLDVTDGHDSDDDDDAIPSPNDDDFSDADNSASSTVVAAKKTAMLATRDDRLNIPKNYLTQVGLDAGSNVKVAFDTDKVVLSKISDDDEATLSVNSDGRLRLNLTQLKDLNAASGAYSIQITADSIEISKYSV